MKKSFLMLIAFILSSPLLAGITDSLSIGIGGGYSSYSTLRGELYLKSELTLFNLPAELKLGINNRSYQLDFDNLHDLNASSIGLFGDVAVYPFQKGLFTGLRWETINFNWFTRDSKSKISNERDYTPTSLYTGTCIFFQLGYHIELSDHFGIKLYGQPGIQQYTISNGSSSSGSYVQTDNDDLIIEENYSFIFNINLSLEIRIK